MKKICALCVVAMLFTLTGCKDATASVSDPGEALISVGGSKVTKEQIYNQMKTAGGAPGTLQLTSAKLYELEEITITDAMKKSGDESTAKLKEQYGDDSFKSMLAQYGYKDEAEYKEKSVYPGLQQKELNKKYINENKDDTLTTFHPVKAKIMEAKDQDSANKALAAIKEGKSFEDAVSEFGATTTYDGKEAIYHTESSLPTAVFTKIGSVTANGLVDSVMEGTTNSNAGTDPTGAPATGAAKYYVAYVTEKDYTKFEADAINKIAETSTSLQTKAMESYLAKHEFHIYDIDIYNGIKQSNPTFIVQ